MRRPLDTPPRSSGDESLHERSLALGWAAVVGQVDIEGPDPDIGDESGHGCHRTGDSRKRRYGIVQGGSGAASLHDQLPRKRQGLFTDPGREASEPDWPEGKVRRCHRELEELVREEPRRRSRSVHDDVLGDVPAFGLAS